MSPLILVTGATGFLGSSLCRRLALEGARVRALVRSSADRGRLAGIPVEIATGDLCEDASLAAACAGVDTVYHCAAAFRKESLDKERFFAVNVEGGRSLVRAAAGAGCRLLVHMSTVGVHGTITHPPVGEDAPIAPEDHYQESKAEGEALVREEALEAGVPLVVVRPVGIYGPGDTRFLKLFRQVKKGLFPGIGSGRTLYHLTYIDDLVEGILLCGKVADARGQTFILGGPEIVTVRSFVEIVAATLGVKPPRLRLPVLPMKILSAVVEDVCRAVGVEPPLYRRRLDFFLKDRAFDIGKARRMLGYEPRIDVREGVRRTVEHYREEGLV